MSTISCVFAEQLVGTNRWGAWVREAKVGGTTSWIYIGSHLTQRLAARCQDRALLFLEANSRISGPLELTFKREDYQEDEQLRSSLRCEQFFELLREESSHSINDVNWPSNASACLRKLYAQEKARGKLSTLEIEEGPFYDIDLSI